MLTRPPFFLLLQGLFPYLCFSSNLVRTGNLLFGRFSRLLLGTGFVRRNGGFPGTADDVVQSLLQTVELMVQPTILIRRSAIYPNHSRCYW